MAFKKGDILKGNNRERDAAFHFIVFLEDKSNNYFIGVVLTHSNKYDDNILLKTEHFKGAGLKGEKFKFQFDNTYFVREKFIKPLVWGPFEKIGELSDAGMLFIETQIKNYKPDLWEQYIKKN